MVGLVYELVGLVYELMVGLIEAAAKAFAGSAPREGVGDRRDGGGNQGSLPLLPLLPLLPHMRGRMGLAYILRGARRSGGPRRLRSKIP